MGTQRRGGGACDGLLTIEADRLTSRRGGAQGGVRQVCQQTAPLGMGAGGGPGQGVHRPRGENS